MTSRSLYEQVGGFDRILALCKRWHELCLQHPVAAHPFEHNLHPNHDERFAAYLAQAWGGPQLYTSGYGDETHVQRIHGGNGIHVELDQICIKLFEDAVSEFRLSDEVANRLTTYFRRATEDMRRFGQKAAVVPDGLPFNYA